MIGWDALRLHRLPILLNHNGNLRKTFDEGIERDGQAVQIDNIKDLTPTVSGCAAVLLAVYACLRVV